MDDAPLDDAASSAALRRVAALLGPLLDRDKPPGWVYDAIRALGPFAAALVPRLVTLLEAGDARVIEVVQGIGHAARAATPALRRLVEQSITVEPDGGGAAATSLIYVGDESALGLLRRWVAALEATVDGREYLNYWTQVEFRDPDLSEAAPLLLRLADAPELVSWHADTLRAYVRLCVGPEEVQPPTSPHDEQGRPLPWAGSWGGCSGWPKDQIDADPLATDLLKAEAVAALTTVIRDGGWAARLRAVKAASLFGPAAAPAVPALIGLLDAETPRVVADQAVWTLAAVGPAASPATPTLLAMAEGAAPWASDRLREAAATAAGMIGDPAALETFRRVLSDPRQRYSLQARVLDALARFGPAAATMVEEVYGVLADPARRGAWDAAMRALHAVDPTFDSDPFDSLLRLAAARPTLRPAVAAEMAGRLYQDDCPWVEVGDEDAQADAAAIALLTEVAAEEQDEEHRIPLLVTALEFGDRGPLPAVLDYARRHDGGSGRLLQALHRWGPIDGGVDLLRLALGSKDYRRPPVARRLLPQYGAAGEAILAEFPPAADD